MCSSTLAGSSCASPTIATALSFALPCRPLSEFDAGDVDSFEDLIAGESETRVPEGVFNLIAPDEPIYEMALFDLPAIVSEVRHTKGVGVAPEWSEVSLPIVLTPDVQMPTEMVPQESLQQLPAALQVPHSDAFAEPNTIVARSDEPLLLQDLSQHPISVARGGGDEGRRLPSVQLPASAAPQPEPSAELEALRAELNNIIAKFPEKTLTSAR